MNFSFFANSISLPKNCMNVLGPCALNKTLSLCIVQYYIVMSDDGAEIYERAKKTLKCMCLCVAMFVCVSYY